MGIFSARAPPNRRSNIKYKRNKVHFHSISHAVHFPTVSMYETQNSDNCFVGRDPFNQNSNRSDREKRTTSKGGPIFSKLFRLDRTDPLSFGPKFPEILVGWIAPVDLHLILTFDYLISRMIDRRWRNS